MPCLLSDYSSATRDSTWIFRIVELTVDGFNDFALRFHGPIALQSIVQILSLFMGLKF